MKRRNFVLLGMAGAAVVSIPAAYYYFGDIEYDATIAQPQSLSLIWDDQTISSIGAVYRKQVPSEKNEQSLVKRLAEGHSKADASIIPQLEANVKSDFETGNTVLVDGWILSLTEARQCALRSALQSKQ